MFAPINIPPGVSRNGTEYQNLGRWYDADLVRWYEGTMRPIGGWSKAIETQMEGPPRGILAWRDNSYQERLAMGTPNGLYVYTGDSLIDITPAGLAMGLPDSFIGTGYGYGVYSNGDYSEDQTSTHALDASTWSFDTWGEYLIACCSTDGKIYEWQNNVGDDAEVVANAPEDCAGVVVTPERILVAYGADGNRKLIKWSTTEDNTVWTPSATNSAGELQLQTSGRILLGKRVRGQTAFLTETELHVMNFIGQPFIFSVEKVGSFCGIIGPQAGEVVEAGLVWMGHNGFFAYDGTLKNIPCEVADYVFGDINRAQVAKVACGHNSTFGEVWWFYPSADSVEVDRYVLWNYRENHWAIGSLARTCWADSGVFQYPMATSVDGYLYEHENGWTDDGEPILSGRYAHSGPVEIGSGGQIMHASQILPDEKTQGQVQFSMRARLTPNGTETSHGPFTVAPYTDCRVTGRHVALDVEGAADADWRVGRLRLDAVPGGRR